MFYYAYLNSDDICESIYPMPVEVTSNQLIRIEGNLQALIGQHYNRTTEEFEEVYYYAVLNDKNIVERVEWNLVEQTTSDSYRSITFAQYQTVQGLYWNGSDYVTPPISVLAKASTDEVNYKTQDKWLSTKLDEMDSSIASAMSGVSTVATDLSTVTTNLQTVVNSLSTLATTVAGKADAEHTHVIADVTGLDGALTGLEEDIDDLQTAVNGKAAASHTHEVADITGLSTALGNIEDDISDLETAVSGKASASHTHDIEDIENLATTITAINSGIADINEDISDLQTDVNGKASASHTHTASDLSGVVKTVNGNAPDSSGNIVVSSGGMTAAEILAALETVDGTGSGLDADKLDGLEASAFALTGHNHDGVYAPATHTHAQYLTENDIESMELVTLEDMGEALDEKADANHNHDSSYAVINHTHAQYLTENDLDDYAKTSDVNTALAGKASTNHSHDSVYAAVNHLHVGYATTGDLLDYAPIQAVNAALAGKSDIIHTHSDYALATDVSDLEETVEDLADTVSRKASDTHSHAQSEVIGLPAALNGKANSTHSHSQNDVTGLSAALIGKANTSHTHSQSDITGLASALSGKANSEHTHNIGEVTGLSEALSSKAAANHTHSSYVTINDVYPVGSLYLSVVNANPSTLFGGTWVLFGSGRTLLGATADGTSEETGGSSMVSIAAHSHTTQGHVLTVSEIPSHHHELLNYNAGGVATETFTKNSVKGEDKVGWTGNVMTSYIGGDGSHSHGDTGSAGAAEISVVQPYITCFIWKRTN